MKLRFILKKGGWVILGALLCAVFKGSGKAEEGMAELRPTTVGAPTLEGQVQFEDTRQGLRVTGTLTGVPPGEHGFHIHEFGVCQGDGTSAGSHYNPGNHEHGNALTHGISTAHAGDLGNVKADSSGKAEINLLLRDVKLSEGKQAVAGRSLVLHERPDDFKQQPSGNSGPRIGCGLITVTAK